MEPTEPIERFPAPSPPTPPQNDSNPLKKILSILVGLKNDFISFVKSLTNRGSYVKVPESEIDQKIQRTWFDATAIPNKSALKSKNGPSKKQSFSENLTSMRTYSPQIDKPIREETPHKRRRNEEKSTFRSVGKPNVEAISPVNEAEKAERFIQKISHPNLSEKDIEKAFKGAQDGAYLINKTDEGLKVIIKRSNSYEIHPFEQLKDEDDMPIDAIKSKDLQYDNFKSFLGSFGVSIKNLINPKSRFKGFSSETFLRELSLSEGKQFLMVKPDRSFTLLRSDKSEFTYMLLIKKEPLLPFFETTIDVVYYKFDKDDKIICNKGRTYPDFDAFLFENGTTMGRGQII